jgi:hypothetical protein
MGADLGLEPVSAAAAFSIGSETQMRMVRIMSQNGEQRKRIP